MPVNPRLRRLLAAALPALLAVAFAACNTATYPNSIFTHTTEFNREIGFLFRILIWLGTAVFVLVEALLLYTIWRYRRRSDDERPEHVHGNTTLEIAWTATPALILALIAVPTVRTIFRTQAKAQADALQVEVIGHQWWWEFRYPQYKITTANELYLPVGRTVNFTLTSQDVIHSFSIPRLGGKRDLIANHRNFLWFTPDSIGEQALNGMCAEYCRASHANMRFKVFTVTPSEFDAWAAHQKTNAVGSALPVPAIAQVDTGKAGHAPTPAAAAPTPVMNVSDTMSATFPRANLPEWVKPKTPTPANLAFDQSVTGDVTRGATMFKTAPCIACHSVRGVPTAAGIIGPNLTHVGSRTTIAGGLYPNDLRHLQLWIKNAPEMKPGSLMPLFGKNEKGATPGLYTDQQIADLAAYLSSLK